MNDEILGVQTGAETPNVGLKPPWESLLKEESEKNSFGGHQIEEMKGGNHTGTFRKLLHENHKAKETKGGIE